MSGFIGAANPQVILYPNDLRLWPEYANSDGLSEFGVDVMYANVGFRNGWWPNGGAFLGEANSMIEAIQYDRPEISRGRTSRYVVNGVTRDVYGTPLGSVTVKLFKTADGLFPSTKDVKVDEGVSDASSGAYSLGTPWYPDTHYVVAYKTGTPDVEGTTANTLIGV